MNNRKYGPVIFLSILLGAMVGLGLVAFYKDVIHKPAQRIAKYSECVKNNCEAICKKMDGEFLDYSAEPHISYCRCLSRFRPYLSMFIKDKNVHGVYTIYFVPSSKEFGCPSQ